MSGSDEKINTQEIKNNLNKKINNSINGKISSSEQKSIDTFVDTICKEYEATISHTSYEKKINEVLKKANKYIDLAKKIALVVIGILVVLLILLTIKTIYEIIARIGCALTIDGLILVLAEKYITSKIKIDTVIILTKGISDVLQSVLKEILSIILNTGSIMLVIGVLLIVISGAIKSIREAKREKEQYTPEN